MPLYIYPEGSAWQPMYDALEAAPNVQVISIVNPNSGPGQTDASYTSAVAKLGAYANSFMIGYVRTGFASRSEAEVTAEIKQWKALYPGSLPSSKLSQQIAYGDNRSDVQGIFFDETAQDAVDYMTRITKVARDTMGAKAQIVFNPGTKASDAYFDIADSVMTAEIPYSDFKVSAYANVAKSSALLYNVPNSGDLQTAVTETVGWHSVFFSKADNAYNKFSPDWMDFVKLVAASAGSNGTAGGKGIRLIQIAENYDADL